MLARPEVGSREHMLLWASGKPADQEYAWGSVKECACGQYSRDNGSERWLFSENMGLLNRLAVEYPRTFGALYERMCKAWR
jgi:hypothetical protein